MFMESKCENRKSNAKIGKVQNTETVSKFFRQKISFFLTLSTLRTYESVRCIEAYVI